MAASRALRSIVSGVERVSSGDRARHYHREAYATVVLAGRFVEASFAGRSTVEPGDVLLHGAFDAHANLGGGRDGPTILRLPWFAAGPEGRFRCGDPDVLARFAEEDPLRARAELAGGLTPVEADRSHWVDQLAADLRDGLVEHLADWAEDHRLSPETVSRAFSHAFQAPPRLFRLEARTRAAWRAVIRGQTGLTGIAHQFGFADLSHMSRSMRRLTGSGPRRWRLSERPDQLRSSAAGVAAP